MNKTALVLAFMALSILLLGCIFPSEPVKQGRDADGTYWRGSGKPLLTVYEYSDFECPNCKSAQPNIEKFLSQYQSKGVRLVYKNFPLEQIHPNSRAAAVAAVCAGREGKFWEYHDLLFKNSPKFSRTDIVSYAASLGLSASFASCLDDPSASDAVDQDLADGLSRGIKATPSFAMGGLIIEGNQPPERLGQAADRAMSGG